jgi:hypothetical protein
MKIYVAGPYSAQTRGGVELNIRRAIDAGIAIFKKGHYPYVPHLTDLIEIRNLETRDGLTYEDYLRWDLPWLMACDGLFYLAPSKGADQELTLAKTLSMHIFYRLEDIPQVGLERFTLPANSV